VQHLYWNNGAQIAFNVAVYSIVGQAPPEDNGRAFTHNRDVLPRGQATAWHSWTVTTLFAPSRGRVEPSEQPELAMLGLDQVVVFHLGKSERRRAVTWLSMHSQSE
jgi:hypothetical protein